MMPGAVAEICGACRGTGHGERETVGVPVLEFAPGPVYTPPDMPMVTVDRLLSSNGPRFGMYEMEVERECPECGGKGFKWVEEEAK
jgi:hypothetical protein